MLNDSHMNKMRNISHCNSWLGTTPPPYNWPSVTHAPNTLINVTLTDSVSPAACMTHVRCMMQLSSSFYFKPQPCILQISCKALHALDLTDSHYLVHSYTLQVYSTIFSQGWFPYAIQLLIRAWSFKNAPHHYPSSSIVLFTHAPPFYRRHVPCLPECRGLQASGNY